jgi:hypothetical protein
VQLQYLGNFSANASRTNVRTEMLSKIQFNGVGELASLQQALTHSAF